ncbi:uncharacterized protein LOC132052584 isoform X1 [Lycium ferocissimum]|uniref:uncharacterized protein LOC132052584 isoform X1 n=1 Tax=Lycium ferocissimum TaxID=112874 RepID=UPI00281558BB|nr:uncharacterized protein LOC132052584 isoform X1 [Lycium ferocissimum]XP_059300172.1 uncharacterized protein LOC132052584 isoform X1 [Lycium ferocissimum]
MEFMHRRKVDISLLLVAVLLILNFTNLEGLSAGPERRLVELDYASNAKQSNDTARIDPLDNFKKYRGGFDITNKHYWSSTIFTGIYGYAIAVLWLLCGLGYGLFPCYKRKHRQFKKRSTCYKHCYIWLTLSAIFLTILAITATGLVLGGSAKLCSRADTVVDIIIDTADGASDTIHTTTGALREMSIDLAVTDIGDEAANFLIPTSNSLDRQAADIRREAMKNKHLIEKGLETLYVVTTLVISLNLVGVIALTVFGILKFRRSFHLLIAVCWIFMILCWLLFGIYFFIDNFAGDTCTALESFQINPYNNSLSSILPCDELLSAESILYEVSEGIHRVVNTVNRELSTHYGNVAQICNPFSGPPEYNYEPDQNCPSSAIRIGDLPQIIKMLACTDTNCKGGVLISRRDFDNIEAYTTALKKILDVYPGMESLAECNTVYDSFSDILDKHCEPLEKNAHMTWGGLIFLSVVMVALVLVWTFDAHHEQNHHHRDFDSSVKPHSSAAIDMLELGTVKEAKADSNPSLVR